MIIGLTGTMACGKGEVVKHLKNKGFEHYIYSDILKEIAKQRNIPRKDVLHAIIARDNDLQLIATDHHFDKLKDITKTKKPVDFI